MNKMQIINFQLNELVSHKSVVQFQLTEPNIVNDLILVGLLHTPLVWLDPSVSEELL